MRALLARACLLLGLTLAAAAHATPTLSIQSLVCNGCTHTVTWSDIAAPTSTDWIGLYTPGAANTSYVKWQYTTGTASGSIPFSFPANVAFGNYELRLFTAFTYNVIATSNSFTVAPTVSGTVTNGGSALAGVSIALNGVPCTTSPAAGAYGCFVPYGWSGTITPSLGGYLFTPASRSLSNVTNHASSQNFATAPALQVSGTITAGASPLAGVAMAGTNGASCTASNASGQYTCAVPPGWSGTVTPSLADHVFTPASRSYTNVTAAQPAQDYTGQVFYQVSGSVTLNGLALADVALAATGGPSCTSSNSAGQYSCTVPLNWSGSVTPSASGYSFGPASRSYTSVASHQTAQTFTATLDTASAPLYFVHVDHLNTPRLVTNDQQQAVWRWDQQEPFGVSVPDENPSSLGAFEFPLRFPGQYADKETNLFFNYFRDYDPATGRYLESDPMRLAGGMDSYSYVGARPLAEIDPTGELSLAACGVPANIPACVAAGIIAGPVASAVVAAGINAALQYSMNQCVDITQLIDVGGDAAQLGLVLGPLGALRGLSVKPVPGPILFGQASVSPTFSAGSYAGQSIAQVAQGLRSGTISPSTLPINYVTVNGQAVALNNRSLLALSRAGIQPTVANNLTNSPAAQASLRSHLKGGQPSNVVRVRGGPPGTSRID